MSEAEPVKLYKPSGNLLTMDGEPATLWGLTVAMYKATHEVDGLNVPGLISNLNEVLTLIDGISAPLVSNLRSLGHSALVDIDHVDGFEMRIEGRNKAFITFARSGRDFVYVMLQFDLSSSIFSSLNRKKERHLEGIFRAIHAQYGDSKNVELGIGPPDPAVLIFGDSETVCTVSEDRESGIFSSRCLITIGIWNREFWNPDALEMNAFIR